MGDPEYTCALFNVILPVAYQFDPDLILVSAGFDAARGDPLGFCKVSPEMYGHIVQQLRNLAGGRVIVALEGGYNLNSISLSMAMCVKALLGDPMPPISTGMPPKPSAVESIRRVVETQSRFWSALRFGKKLPDSFQDLKAQMGSIVKEKKPADRKSVYTVQEVHDEDGGGDLAGIERSVEKLCLSKNGAESNQDDSYDDGSHFM